MAEKSKKWIYFSIYSSQIGLAWNFSVQVEKGNCMFLTYHCSSKNVIEKNFPGWECAPFWNGDTKLICQHYASLIRILKSCFSAQISTPCPTWVPQTTWRLGVFMHIAWLCKGGFLRKNAFLRVLPEKHLPHSFQFGRIIQLLSDVEIWN